MKKTIFLSLTALIAVGCGGSASVQNTANTNSANTTTTTTTASSPKKDDLTVRSHETQKAPAGQSNSGSGGSPMQKSVDVTAMTADIEKAEKEYKAKPADAAAKDALAAAYFKRAFALTEAAQYRAALGDFRKGLKLKPENQEAKNMHDQIISIFQSIGREPPKEGEEPPPMPVEKSN
jgi:hypothetical protein